MRRDCARRLPALTLVAAMALLGASAIGRPARAVGTDYCVFGEHTSLFVVDRTTRFDQTDQDILVAAADTFFRSQTPGERVIVAAVGGAYTDIRLVFNECRPGCREGGVLGRLVSTCRAVIARADYAGFERRFIQVLIGLLKQTEEASASDLFRSVAEATRLVGANGYKPLRQMALYSDLLEASAVFPGGQIRRLQPPDVLRRLESERIEARLDGAGVRVVGFGRDDAVGRRALPQDVRRRVEESWRAWLTRGGGGDIQIGLR